MKIRLPSGSGMIRLPSTPLTPTTLYTNYFQPRRRSTPLRLAAIFLSLAICYFIVSRPALATVRSSSLSAIQDHLPLGQASIPVPAKANTHEEYPTDQTQETPSGVESIGTPSHYESEHGNEEQGVDLLEGPSPDEEEVEIQPGEVAVEDTDEPEVEINESENSGGINFMASPDEAAFESSPLTGSVEHFKKALRAVLSMEPDEIYIRDLLKPILGGGEEKLKEIGIRTRAYNKYFRIWEALHLISDDSNTVVRDDVIQYLRRTPDVSDISSISRSAMIRSYEVYRSFITRLASLLFPWTAPYFSDHMTLHAHFRHGGRGIVVSGNDGQAPYLLTSLMSFRELGCTLPVEVMYLGEDDLGDDYRSRLEAIPGVTTRDMRPMIVDAGWEVKGWASKAFALLMSSFREVIYLDADALFFVNPEVLFDDPGYVETGALFFRDRVFYPSSRKTWLRSILPKPISKKAQESRYWTGSSKEMQESGCMVVDKWRHFIAMLLVTRMNGPDRGDDPVTGEKGVYSLFYGDKETFWLGWELAGDTDYHFHQGDAGCMGVQKEARKEMILGSRITHGPNVGLHPTEQVERTLWTVDSPQLLHLDTSGTPLWFNGWILDDKFEDRMGPVSHFEMYLSEQKSTDEAPEWRLGGHNKATLISDVGGNFTSGEKGVLNMILEIAKDNGAVSKNA